MNVLKLVDIDEDDYSIEVQFEITMKWKENRAAYHNLKSRDSLNALTQRDYDHMKDSGCPKSSTRTQTRKKPQGLVSMETASGSLK